MKFFDELNIVEKNNQVGTKSILSSILTNFSTIRISYFTRWNYVGYRKFDCGCNVGVTKGCSGSWPQKLTQILIS